MTTKNYNTMRNTQVRNTQGGQALVIAVFFFIAISASIVFSFAFPLVRQTKEIRQLHASQQALATAESSLEDVVYRLNHQLDTSLVETVSIGEVLATTTTTNIPPDRKNLLAQGSNSALIRRAEIELILGSGAAFNFGVQSGEGGLDMRNTSSIVGNAFSNGSITGANSNIVRGDVISAGPTGTIDGIAATGTIYAHTISNNTVDKDAYYQIDAGGNTIAGTAFPDSPDQATATLPISDGQIEEWKTDAQAGGVYTGECPYVIDDTQTIGPLKIPCDLHVQKSSADVTIAGNIWIEGNFITDVGSPAIRIDPSLGDKSVVVVADDELDRETGSKIELRNGAQFFDSGTDGSFIVLISQNESAENGGTEIAIDITQSAEGDFLVYAGHGEIAIAQSATLREVTAHTISLSQSTEVIYESGLASLLFTGGPGGGFEIVSWEEIP